MTLAKSLCGGIAGGAMLARADVAVALKPGTHAATFGGNPIAAVAGIATLETIEQDGLLPKAKELGEFFRRRFTALQQECPLIKEVRAQGVMIGIELTIDGTPIVKACIDRRLLVNCTHGNVLRLLPAMNLTDSEFNEGMTVLEDVFSAYRE
jgi:acetylornithine/succinyldiaminopimelate/putrescine aminotransferase